MRNMMNKEQMIAHLMELSRIELERAEKETDSVSRLLYKSYASAYELAAKEIERNLKP